MSNNFESQTESEILSELLDCLRRSEDCCRRMTYKRMDHNAVGWTKAATSFRMMRDKVTELARRGIYS